MNHRTRQLGTRLSRFAILAVAAGLPAATTLAGLNHEWMMKKIGNEPAMVNAPWLLRSPTNAAAIKQLTINPATGILYGSDPSIFNNGRPHLWLLDSAIVSTPSAPVNALFGSIGDPLSINTNQYTGSVPEGPRNRNGPGGAAMTFNPAVKDGVLVNVNTPAWYHFEEFAVQPPEAPDGNSTNDWGWTRETSGVSNVAFVSDATCLIYGSNNGLKEGLGFLDKTSVTGTGAGEKYRFVWHPIHHGDPAADHIRISHMDTAYTALPTDSSAGTRAITDRPGSAVLMDKAQLDALRPSGTIDGLAVRQEVGRDLFDIYMLFSDGGSSPTEADDVTYLAAIRASIPSDGSPMGYQVIDLDPMSTNNWLQLKDTLADKDIVATGLAFSKDGETMYVASYLDYATGNAAYDVGRIYIFHRRLLKGTVVVFR
jgi:hypothetical protein